MIHFVARMSCFACLASCHWCKSTTLASGTFTFHLFSSFFSACNRVARTVKFRSPHDHKQGVFVIIYHHDHGSLPPSPIPKSFFSSWLSLLSLPSMLSGLVVSDSEPPEPQRGRGPLLAINGVASRSRSCGLRTCLCPLDQVRWNPTVQVFS